MIVAGSLQGNDRKSRANDTNNDSREALTAKQQERPTHSHLVHRGEPGFLNNRRFVFVI
jgi:hypothetical protein